MKEILYTYKYAIFSLEFMKLVITKGAKMLLEFPKIILKIMHPLKSKTKLYAIFKIESRNQQLCVTRSEEVKCSLCIQNSGYVKFKGKPLALLN